MPHKTCPTCQTTIPPELTDGLCPKCLLGDEELRESTSGGSHDATLDSSASTPQRSESTLIGKKFGDYELLNEIARGGMGVVYRARDIKLNREVALKMILSGEFAHSSDIERFQQEAAAAANLDHPAIVPIYEIGEHSGQHFFSMKLIEGGSLADRMTELSGKKREIVGLIEKAARGVHFAHQRGILHRDLKPANILLTKKGEPIITDLGLAKQMKGDSGITHTGAVVGTPAYMPPEQAAAKKEITTAADIYSLGAILYEAMTGSPPHRGDSPVETLMMVMDSDVTRPSEKSSGIDRTLELICMKCLQRDPEQRYTSAAALADDLQNWLQGEPVSVKPRSAASIIGDALLANLRSAIGAVLIGTLAGVLFSYNLSRGHGVSEIQDNPPVRIYEMLPGEISFGRNLVFIREQDMGNEQLLFIFMALGVLFWTGFVLVGVTKARYGSESFALGTIASIMMCTMAVLLCFGPADLTKVREKLQLFARGTFGTNEQRATIHTELFESYPGLEKLAPEERANTIAFRIYYDNLYRHAIHMLKAILSAVLLCGVPCIPATNFAAKLRRERGSMWSSFLPYTEFSILLVLAAFICWFQALLPADGANVDDFIVSRWGIQLGIYTFLIGMAVSIYRRKFSWKWRLLAYIVGLALLVTAVSR